MGSFDLEPDWVTVGGRDSMGEGHKRMVEILNTNIACFKVYVEQYFSTIFHYCSFRRKIKFKSNLVD